MMASPPKPLRWASSCPDRVVEVPLVYVQYEGTASGAKVIGPAPSILACRDCRRSEELCRCNWRSRD